MKKLVTIVSAVMMLLMLAACAPGLSADKEQLASISKGNTALQILAKVTGEDVENKDGGITYTLKEDFEEESLQLDEEMTVTNVTVSSGSTYKTAVTGTTTKTATVEADGTVTWTEAAPTIEDPDKTETYTVDVTFKGTMTQTTTGDDAGMTLDLEYFTVDGVKYTETLSEGYKVLMQLLMPSN